MSKLILENLIKNFDGLQAVRNLSLEIGLGEFFSLLGPSGCGKTTTLRMIAGFEFPTSGRILFGEREVTYLKPNLRNTGMVFQNFALFPHMTVFENVAFGLQARKIAKAEIPERVKQALVLVDLAGFEQRKVTQLSGGQQQRVALARAVVIEPDILLLDEPLSNLDAKLREETRAEIHKLQRRLGITTIYVTHDQEEALSLSDRIAVMNSGVCQQVGTPAEIYGQPANAFVARFVGNANIVTGKIINEQDGVLEIELPNGVKLASRNTGHPAPDRDGSVAISLKPEAIRVRHEFGNRENEMAATISDIRFSGSFVDYQLEAGGIELRARHLLGKSAFAQKAGDQVIVQIEPEQIQILPPPARDK